MQSSTASVWESARLKAMDCASGDMGKEEVAEGEGAINGKSRLTHCCLSRCRLFEDTISKHD